MRFKKRIYKALKESNLEDLRALPYEVIHPIAFAADKLGFDGFLEYYREVIGNILNSGTSIMLTKKHRTERKEAGLPDLKFGTEDLKIIAKALGLGEEEEEDL